ncbi:MAG: hypothetical protein RM338_27525, partial [Nostoc sp. DedQUE12a]|nr:hypothetical protein [Nostoc sp. DedQUE12a]
LFRISLTILGNEFIITIKLIYFKPSPKITIFWVIFIGFFLTFNTSATKGASGGAIIGQIGSDYYVFALHSGSDKVNGLLLNRAVQISRIR